jgi:hypothetical protein
VRYSRDEGSSWTCWRGRREASGGGQQRPLEGKKKGGNGGLPTWTRKVDREWPVKVGVQTRGSRLFIERTGQEVGTSLVGD